MSEFRVKVTVRNNLLLSAMEAAGYVGYGSLRRFARDAGVDQTQLSLMLSMKTPVLTKDGEFSVMAKALMEALGAAPSDLWTEQQLTMCLERNGAEFVMSQGDMNRMIAEAQSERLEDSSVDPIESTRRRMVSRILEKNLSSMLSKNEELVLRLRFGVGVDGERTLEQCAKVLDVTRERIRQIEAGALRKLKLKLEVGPSDLALAADEFGL